MAYKIGLNGAPFLSLGHSSIFCSIILSQLCTMKPYNHRTIDASIMIVRCNCLNIPLEGYIK